MIKVGIMGAGSPVAGEIIRLLINHPETDIISLYAPAFLGRNVSSVHHGLIGETIVNFSDKIKPEELDVIFISEYDPLALNILNSRQNWPSLKIIDVSGLENQNESQQCSDLGLSEANRKSLVRGASIAYIAPPPLVPALISLLPLAKFMLLNSTLFIKISIPAEILSEYGKPDTLTRYLLRALKETQSSFNSDIVLTLTNAPAEQRVMVMNTTIDCNLSLDEIEKIYDGIYDDHNFTFVIHTPVSSKEVEGTQKCIISLDKPTPEKLEISVFADGRMRGGAGDAVHVMNLFEGLHEKTGLQLKSSAFDSGSTSQSSSWFA